VQNKSTGRPSLGCHRALDALLLADVGPQLIQFETADARADKYAVVQLSEAAPYPCAKAHNRIRWMLVSRSRYVRIPWLMPKPRSNGQNGRQDT
jgi:hypothetical protein